MISSIRLWFGSQSQQPWIFTAWRTAATVSSAAPGVSCCRLVGDSMLLSGHLCMPSLVKSGPQGRTCSGRRGPRRNLINAAIPRIRTIVLVARRARFACLTSVHSDDRIAQQEQAFALTSRSFWFALRPTKPARVAGQSPSTCWALACRDSSMGIGPCQPQNRLVEPRAGFSAWQCSPETLSEAARHTDSWHRL